MFAAHNPFLDKYFGAIRALRECDVDSVKKWLMGNLREPAARGGQASVPLPEKEEPGALEEWLALLNCVPLQGCGKKSAHNIVNPILRYAEEKGFLEALANCEVQVSGYVGGHPSGDALLEPRPLTWHHGLHEFLAAMPQGSRLLSRLPPASDLGPGSPHYSRWRDGVGDRYYDYILPKALAHATLPDVKWLLMTVNFPRTDAEEPPDGSSPFTRNGAHERLVRAACQNRRNDVFEHFLKLVPPGQGDYSYTLATSATQGLLKGPRGPRLAAHDWWGFLLQDRNHSPAVLDARFRMLQKASLEGVAGTISRARPCRLPKHLLAEGVGHLGEKGVLLYFVAALQEPSRAAALRKDLLPPDWWKPFGDEARAAAAPPRAPAADYIWWAGHAGKGVLPAQQREMFLPFGAPLPAHAHYGTPGGPSPNPWKPPSLARCAFPPHAMACWPEAKEDHPRLPYQLLEALEALTREDSFSAAPASAREAAAGYLLWLTAGWLLWEKAPERRLAGWVAKMHRRWPGLNLAAIYGGVLAVVAEGSWCSGYIPPHSVGPFTAAAAQVHVRLACAAGGDVLVPALALHQEATAERLRAHAAAMGNWSVGVGRGEARPARLYSSVALSGWCRAWAARLCVLRITRKQQDRRRQQLVRGFRDFLDFDGGRFGFGYCPRYGAEAPKVSQVIHTRAVAANAIFANPRHCGPEELAHHAVSPGNVVLAAKADGVNFTGELCEAFPSLARHELGQCPIQAEKLQRPEGGTLWLVYNVAGVPFLNYDLSQRLALLRAELSPHFGWAESAAPAQGKAFFEREGAALAAHLCVARAVDLALGRESGDRLWVKAAWAPPADCSPREFLSLVSAPPPVGGTFPCDGWVSAIRARLSGNPEVSPIKIKPPEELTADLRWDGVRWEPPTPHAPPAPPQAAIWRCVWAGASDPRRRGAHPTEGETIAGDGWAVRDPRPEKRYPNPANLVRALEAENRNPWSPSDLIPYIDRRHYSATPVSLSPGTREYLRLERESVGAWLGAAGLLRARRVFDAGCGHGRHLDSRVGEWVGVDWDPAAVWRARERNPGATWHWADVAILANPLTGAPLPLTPASFDFLVAVHSLHSAAETPARLTAWAEAVGGLASAQACLCVRIPVLESLPCLPAPPSGSQLARPPPGLEEPEKYSSFPDSSWARIEGPGAEWPTRDAARVRTSLAWAASGGSPRTETFLRTEALVETFEAAGWALCSAEDSWPRGSEALEGLEAHPAASGWAPWARASKNFTFVRRPAPFLG